MGRHDIYIVTTLAPGGEDLCGISSFVDSEVQGIVMSESCFALPDNPSTLSHEVGHYFNLLHTHTGSSDQDGDGVIDGLNAEYVDGTECESRGDDLCDTSADPNLGDFVNSQCEYTGDYIDGHGDLYNPDTANLMSYSDKICRDDFSLEQENIIIYTLLEFRPELNTPSLNPNIILDSYLYEIIGGDGDDVLNPGDSFNLTITLENEEGWADANSIQVDLNCTDQSVSLSNSQFNFNLLEAGEVFTNDSSIEVVLGEDISLDDIDFVVNVTAIGSDSYNYSENLSFSIPVSLMQSGYPYDTNSQVDSSPLIVDLDGDSSLEIIFGDYADSIQVLSYSGQPIISDIFPYGTQDDIWSSAASADIDLDGILDFAITSKDKNLYVLDQNGLKFTYMADQFLIGTPVIGNIDADDELEIVFGGNDSSGDIFAVNHDGTSVTGFPVEMNEKIWSGFALADFNGNGLDDIIVATDGEDFIGVCYDDGNLDTLFVAGNKFRNSPSIVKVNDSYIVMAGSDDDSMYGVSSSGELVFEIETGGNVRSSASFVNIDGQAYAFFGSDDELLYAVDMNGDALAGWPQNVGGDVDDAVSFADLDGDGDPEAIIGVLNKVYAYHMDGSLYDRFPVSYEFSFTSPPVIKDLDLDGDLEITLGSSGSVVSIDIMEQGSLSSFGIPYWSQGSADNRRTSYYEIQEVECGSPMDGDLNCDGYSDVLDIVTILGSILNGSDLTLYEAWASDINGDGNIDVLDVVGIVNMIISG